MKRLSSITLGPVPVRYALIPPYVAHVPHPAPRPNASGAWTHKSHGARRPAGTTRAPAASRPPQLRPLHVPPHPARNRNGRLVREPPGGEGLKGRRGTGRHGRDGLGHSGDRQQAVVCRWQWHAITGAAPQSLMWRLPRPIVPDGVFTLCTLGELPVMGWLVTRPTIGNMSCGSEAASGAALCTHATDRTAPGGGAPNNKSARLPPT